MVKYIYIVWCKPSKKEKKFDMGIFISEKKATKQKDIVKSCCMSSAKIWIEKYKLLNYKEL